MKKKKLSAFSQVNRGLQFALIKAFVNCSPECCIWKTCWHPSSFKFSYQIWHHNELIAPLAEQSISSETSQRCVNLPDSNQIQPLSCRHCSRVALEWTGINCLKMKQWNNNGTSTGASPLAKGGWGGGGLAGSCIPPPRPHPPLSILALCHHSMK